MFSLPFLSGPTRRHPPPPGAPRPRELRLHIATGQPSSPTRLYNYKAPHSHALRPLTLAAPALPASPSPPRSGLPDGLHARHPQALRAGAARGATGPGCRAGYREGGAVVQI